jgi:UDP-glucose-4-epimerase
MKILVTGGTGFIGSHTVVELLNNNDDVVILDNFSNSKRNVIDKIKKITGKDFSFYEGSVQNESVLKDIFDEHYIDAVIHFASYKAVGESVEKPIMYYDNNLSSTLSLLKVMSEAGCKNLVFSSSATVYGSPKSLPIKEDFPLSTTNPYGTTKLMIERILEDVYRANKDFNFTILRYFNPVGAHSSGLIGEEPSGTPNNLMPYIVKVASGELPHVNVFGNDYDTHDGTGVRDYIHVVDLAKGHINACHKIKESGLKYYNLGTGTGYSVLDLISTFSKVNDVEIDYKITNRRPGDIASCYADPVKAKEGLDWKAEKGLEEMCKDSYNFIKNNKKLY